MHNTNILATFVDIKLRIMEEEVFTLEEIEDKLIKFVGWKGKIESDYDIEDFLNFMQNERGCNK